MVMPVRPWVTTRTRKAFAIAHDLADQLGHENVTPVHVTLGLLREGLNIAAQTLLYRRDVQGEILERELEAQLPPPGTPRPATGSHSWTPSDERMLERAAAEAQELGTAYFGCEHVLLAFLRDPTSVPAQVLAHLRVASGPEPVEDRHGPDCLLDEPHHHTARTHVRDGLRLAPERRERMGGAR